MRVKQSRKQANRSPEKASQLLEWVRTNHRVTYNQSTILSVYRVLFTELENDSTVHPDGGKEIRTDLVLYDDVPGILCKFIHCTYVCIIFLISNCTDFLQSGLQLVLDFFKGSAVILT